METEALKEMAISALEDVKAKDIKVLDVRGKSSITDIMIIAGGTSDRHLKSLAMNVIAEAKKQGIQPLGVEGENSGEWVLVDLGDVVVHIMMPAVRDFYNLEKLWVPDNPEQEQQA
ncbi:MAG: ribosome silencing factor [Gammaproteobacteria bacterium]|nr:ribosome silencing factor [Gammaproteobacteria bacterium]